MNKANLKSYAPKARLDFIKAVTERANVLGISAAGVVPAEVRGDVALIDGREWPAKVAGQRDELIARIKRHGFEQTMEEVAYTWFNRFAALRYMEIHDYLGHGWRVLSSRDGGLPEILRHASEVTLPGLNADRAREMQLAGNQDNELYKLLLVAQCNELSGVMPFLFERIDDETELLLPENLLRTDSIVAKLVSSVPNEDWQEIEIIGWLYQFYISDRKDQVIGKVVGSSDIPAATQIFTPNWIVKYMVHNSLGSIWLATYPNSSLREKLTHYVEPAEQTSAVEAQLASLVPSQLVPEEITLIDPASGSGHILTEAYEGFKAIYLERGYRIRDIPKLILERNLFGLDIDKRAAQLGGFALMMKARADDRRLFEKGIKLNLIALTDSAGFNVDALANGIDLSSFNLQKGDISGLKSLFESATTFGSLIQIPDRLVPKLPALRRLSETLSQDLFVADALRILGPLVQQAEILAARYDVVVANPPYMGSKSYCAILRDFVGDTYKAGKSDLYSAFTLRNIQFAKYNGYIGMITIPNWMFLSSFEGFREAIYEETSISSLAHNGRGVWGSDFGSCSFVLRRASIPEMAGRYMRLFEKQGSVASNEELELRFHNNPRFSSSVRDFQRIPGSPVAYWLSEALRATFEKHKCLADVASPKEGLNTTDNERFLRRWWECGSESMKINAVTAEEAFASGAKWFPCQKGGDFRKWFGNSEYVVNWKDSGSEIKKVVAERYGSVTKRVVNEHLYFREGISWSSVSIAQISMRFIKGGQIFETAGNMCFFKNEADLLHVLGFSNSCVATPLLQCLSPTVSFKPGPIGRLPIVKMTSEGHLDIIRAAIGVAKSDWDSYERSWDFLASPILAFSKSRGGSLQSSYESWIEHVRKAVSEMKGFEEANNRFFVHVYGLNAELESTVPIEQITLTANPAYRYGGELTSDEQWNRFKQDTLGEFISFVIGCMMGRYSLDVPGLIYAVGGNDDFDASRYKTFAADTDAIIPVTHDFWFEDDAAARVREFLRTAMGAESLEQNMAWLANGLGVKASETPDDAIRRFIAESFFREHLQRYKRRPIYWLFSSGKQGAFQALVYLHRYNEGTLSRMRAEYVVPLIAKTVARLEMLDKDVAAASSAAARTKLQKQIEALRKKQLELLAYDEKLRHYADMRITLDLDDGVKVNYAKFGDLVAESKAITGGSDE
jgi:hypothetical protein